MPLDPVSPGHTFTWILSVVFINVNRERGMYFQQGKRRSTLHFLVKRRFKTLKSIFGLILFLEKINVICYTMTIVRI